MDLDVRAKITIILGLLDEVLYKVMNEKTTTGLWCKLKSLYLPKSLTNKLFLKKQLYSFRIKEGISVLQHLNAFNLQYLNAFNRNLSDMLALKVKLEEEDKTLLLLSSLPQSYDHLARTIMYEKETVELEYVRQIFQNNKLMKKTDSTEKASNLVVKEQGERSQSRGPKKGGTKASSENFNCYYCKQPGHMKKTCS